ncbi:DNA polymerase III subunit beta [Mycoplasma elephantis]|uniref:DNA polymerase III subunit beta n=1 Tax=Mycoplasma elephantis TaxID=114882 RepID=UPI00047FC4F8|nr:DNA polymerase III subunit beta [Mycoplasma elephantis]
MNFKIKKNLLEKHLNIVGKAIDVNNVMMQFRGVYIKVYEREIELIGTDGELSIKTRIPLSNDLEIYEPGEVLIYYDFFKKSVTKVNGEITILKNNNTIILNSGQTKYELALLKSQEYQMPIFSLSGEKITLNYSEFKEAVNNVIFAINEKDPNPRFASISFNAKNNKLEFLASDKYRFARHFVNIEQNAEFQKIVKAKNIKKMLIDDGGKKVDIYANDIEFTFVTKDTIIVSKIVDTMFIDYTKTIPNEFISTITVEKKDISDLISKIFYNSDDKNNRFTLIIKNDKLVATGNVQEMAKMESSISQFVLQGKPLEIDFNFNFFNEAIQVFDKEIVICISSDIQKVLIISKYSPNTQQLIAPLRRA